MSGFFFFFLRCGPTPKSVHQFGQKVTHTLTHWHTGHTDPRRGAKGWPADQSLPVSTGSVRPRTRRRICCGWRSEGAWSPPPLVPSRSRPSAAGQSANGPSGHPFFSFSSCWPLGDDSRILSYESRSLDIISRGPSAVRFVSINFELICISIKSQLNDLFDEIRLTLDSDDTERSSCIKVNS